MKKNTILLIAAWVLLLPVSLCAQNKTLSTKQLMSRQFYPQRTMSNFQFVGKSNLLSYSTDSLLFLGKATAPKQVLSLSSLNSAMRASGNPELRYLPRFTFINEKELSFNANGKIYNYNLSKKTVTTVLDYGTKRSELNIAPDKRSFAYTDGNALVVSAPDGKQYRFDDNKPGIVYGQAVHRHEFGISGGIFWAPDASKVAFYRMDESMVAQYPLVNTATRIAQPEMFRYPMAGEKSHEVTIGILDIASGKHIYLNTRRDSSMAEREMYLTNLTWSPDGQSLYVVKVNRDQNHIWVERYNATTGKLDKRLFEEQHQRYVEPCEGLYFLPNDSDHFLWFSMRDGYKHLYLYATDGTLTRQITSGSFEVQQVIGFDKSAQNIFVYANKDNLSGLAAYKVNIATGEFTRLTPAEGTHSVVISPDGTAWVDSYSSVQVPAKIDLYLNNGKTTKNLYTAPNPLSEFAMPDFSIGTIKAADGKTDLYYRLITPPNLDSTKQYPTLVYVYGGPHSQLVTDSWLAGANLYFTFLAQQGYVVFTLDNRGTDNRGFEFESCTHRQLGTIELADQMEGVKFLHSLPFVDRNRMGVEGWSFGGFMTITMKLAHPEIFKVGCAGGPVIDWKWYEIMYGERYMDTPQQNPEGYKNAALTAKASQLDGRLLVIHGAQDNVVVWQNSIEFVESCIKAGKQVDYFVYPHHEHNVLGYDRIHLFEKMFDYYETHLK